ncbi:predicted protein [Enterococcus faecium 1,230,933]|uniref:Uncharacterized protein n=1 Tax=Siphoviridae sp. ctTRl7 TaxID=2827876 RepID=A0A8S5SYZ5_9CAUD|nr:predicted protein [Enterococcus faecium 1,230,933]DAF56112.1 MAG TPA: hypothetical protein [Siphoviridae sp. ctTRl7]
MFLLSIIRCCLLLHTDRLGGLFILAENLHFRWPIIGGGIACSNYLKSLRSPTLRN